MHLRFEKSTMTIRQEPQNYMIANYDEDKRVWVCDTDLAADKKLATEVFLALLEFENKHTRDGQNIIDWIMFSRPMVL